LFITSKLLKIESKSQQVLQWVVAMVLFITSKLLKIESKSQLVVKVSLSTARCL